MREEGQMFLMGAILLSVAFFGTAALQASSSYVIQEASHEELDLPDKLTWAIRISELADNSCLAPTEYDFETCVQGQIAYMESTSPYAIDASFQSGGCILFFEAITITVEISDHRSSLQHEDSFSISC